MLHYDESYNDSLKYWINRGDNMNESFREGSIDKNGVVNASDLSLRQCKMYKEYHYHLKRLDELLSISKLPNDETFRRCICEDLYSELKENNR